MSFRSSLRSLYSFFLLLLVALLVSSCSHTNELKKYSFDRKSIEYKHRVSGDAASGGSYLPSTGSVIGDIVGSVGSAVLSGKVAEKLDRSAKPEKMAESISSAIQEATNNYLQVALANLGTSSDYVFETDLVEYRLSCSSTGIQVQAEAYCRLLERRTGRLVWDDCESKTVYLTRNGAVILAPAAVGAVVGAISCTELLDMSEEDIRKGLDGAAREVAYLLSETLREDVAEMHEE